MSPGNLHDSRTFKGLYDKIKNIGIKTIIADAGYKVPAIAKMLIDDGIEPLFPYKRPQTKEGFFKKYEYAYDNEGNITCIDYCEIDSDDNVVNNKKYCQNAFVGSK